MTLCMRQKLSYRDLEEDLCSCDSKAHWDHVCPIVVGRSRRSRDERPAHSTMAPGWGLPHLLSHVRVETMKVSVYMRGVVLVSPML